MDTAYQAREGSENEHTQRKFLTTRRANARSQGRVLGHVERTLKAIETGDTGMMTSSIHGVNQSCP